MGSARRTVKSQTRVPAANCQCADGGISEGADKRPPEGNDTVNNPESSPGRPVAGSRLRPCAESPSCHRFLPCRLTAFTELLSAKAMRFLKAARHADACGLHAARKDNGSQEARRRRMHRPRNRVRNTSFQLAASDRPHRCQRIEPACGLHAGRNDTRGKQRRKPHATCFSSGALPGPQTGWPCRCALCVSI